MTTPKIPMSFGVKMPKVPKDMMLDAAWVKVVVKADTIAGVASKPGKPVIVPEIEHLENRNMRRGWKRVVGWCG